ncbi:hypothetical protein CR513_17193, partial [Mucuna pruriens]
MISLGYKQSQGDHTLFIKHSHYDKLTLLLVYVDDMINKYVLDLLKEIGKLGCKTFKIPIKWNHKIGSEESSVLENSQYHSLVGKPNIAYVSVVNQFMYASRESHMWAVDKILQYLKENPRKGLLFKREGALCMKLYTNAN